MKNNIYSLLNEANMDLDEYKKKILMILKRNHLKRILGNL
ncbi:hypothetical protein DFH46_001805 [Clostridium beijerinckii]|nr:hypothetical protein [Clostridium beijerinckii]NSA04105.1 hypothetical protein [Clostridium beijerinckii]